MKRFLTPIALSCALVAQTPSLAHRIYQKDSASVLALQVLSADGQPAALGTGFVIADGKIVTNHHVTADGQVFVEVGPAKLPAKVVATDAVNDLSILEVNADLGVPALPLASAPASPGDAVYVIGAPEGFAHSISTGVVAAYRKLQGRPVLQITAPISHGSSGSPVVDSQGKVIGVVEAFWSQGENLNFAVPAAQLRALLAGKTGTSALALIEAAEQLQRQLQATTYSSDASSAYQTLLTHVDNRFRQALAAVGSNLTLIHRIYSDVWFGPIAVSAARAEVTARADSGTELDLAIALENAQKTNAALQAASASIRLLRGPEAKPYIEEGDVLNELQRYSEADRAFRSGLSVTEPAPATSWKQNAYLGLAQADSALGRAAESEAWFRKAAMLGDLAYFDWAAEGDRLSHAGNASDAAIAYQYAATLADKIGVASCLYWNNAGDQYNNVQKPDAALAAYRGCLATQDSASSLAHAHVQVADILNRRHVYAAALQEAQAAAAAQPSNAFAFDEEADAYEGLQEYSDGVTAEKTALALSDGRYGFMDFELGSLYFDQKEWSLALPAFKQAASMSKSDWAAAYNVALCDNHLHYYGDALRWYKEALERQPPASQRVEIKSEISTLEGMGY